MISLNNHGWICVAPNDSIAYLRAPWRILTIGGRGLAFFGGLLAAVAAGVIWTRRHAVPFARARELFAPAVPIAAAIGRIPYWLAGMDYGTTTNLPWGVIYTPRRAMHRQTGLPVTPCSFTSSSAIWRLPRSYCDGAAGTRRNSSFPVYLVLFSLLRFVGSPWASCAATASRRIRPQEWPSDHDRDSAGNCSLACGPASRESSRHDAEPSRLTTAAVEQFERLRRVSG